MSKYYKFRYISDNIIILNDGLGLSVNPNMSSGLLDKTRYENNQFVGWDEEEGSFILGNTTMMKRFGSSNISG